MHLIDLPIFIVNDDEKQQKITPMTQNGFLYSRVLDGHGGATSFTTFTDINSWLPENGKLWVHLDYSQEESKRWLTEHSGLSPLAIEALTADETRPRISKVDTGHLIFLRGVNLNPAQTPEDMVSIRLFIDQNRVISARRRPLLSVQDLVQQLDNGDGPENISQLLCQLTENLTSRMQSVVTDLEEQLDDFELAIEDPKRTFHYHEISQNRRQAISLRRYIRPQREALLSILTMQTPWLEEADKIRLSETINHLTRYIEELDMAIERAQILQQELTNQVNEQLNQRMYIMSVVAALFLPLGFLTGLLGVNIGGIPGTEFPYAFIIFVTALVVLTVGIAVYFKKKKWI